MDRLLSTVIYLGVLFLGLMLCYVQGRQRERWWARMERTFRADLAHLQLEGFELLVDKVKPPVRGRATQIYRILRGHCGRYFLYMSTDDCPAVIKQLSEERALLAARQSGYTVLPISGRRRT
ncbi:hypothetical protein [Pseudomonas sp. NPDC089401]|uniref:hypothetical protein n=1 Tax=Pseudomonas sp. NPDC089401 TaxID=3364462 RepID=UPI0037F3CED4